MAKIGAGLGRPAKPGALLRPAAALRRLRAGIDRRLFLLRGSEAGEVRLTPRRVFIVPARSGLAFAVLLVLLFIGAVNYNLGLGYALTYFATACAIVDMVMTAGNLSGLYLAPGRATPVFAGDEALFELQLINRSRRDRYAVHIDFISAGAARHAADVSAGASAAVLLSAGTAVRGRMAAPRVRLSSSFPLGLFRAWSYWQPQVSLLVYPCPERAAAPLPLAADTGGDGHGRAGGDEFAGVRGYLPGDGLRQLAWRQIARLDPALGGPLLSKHFDGAAAAELVLDLALLPASLGLEIRLSRLTAWVLEAERQDLAYGLRLGQLDIRPARGAAQRAACLGALALYGLEDGAP